MDDFSQKLYDALKESCNSCSSNLLSLSGGLDSSILALLLQHRKPQTVAIIAKDFLSNDLTYCQMVAKEMQMPLAIHHVTTTEILQGIEETIKILRNFNDIEIRNNVVMYLAIKWAKDNGMDSIITGDGADELFAGYNFLINTPPDRLDAEIERVCTVMHFPTQDIGKALGIRVHSPFLNDNVIQIAKKIPSDLKVRSKGTKTYGKWILRKTFESRLPKQIAWRAKSPMQDGAGTAGLTGLFNSIIDERRFVEKKLTVQNNDDVIIRSRESMYYYEIFQKHFELPAADTGAAHPCPYCKHSVGESKFCRMCGAFPI